MLTEYKLEGMRMCRKICVMLMACCNFEHAMAEIVGELVELAQVAVAMCDKNKKLSKKK